MNREDVEVARRIAAHNFNSSPSTTVEAIIQLRTQNEIIIRLLEEIKDKMK